MGRHRAGGQSADPSGALGLAAAEGAPGAEPQQGTERHGGKQPANRYRPSRPPGAGRGGGGGVDRAPAAPRTRGEREAAARCAARLRGAGWRGVGGGKGPLRESGRRRGRGRLLPRESGPQFATRRRALPRRQRRRAGVERSEQPVV